MKLTLQTMLLAALILLGLSACETVKNLAIVGDAPSTLEVPGVDVRKVEGEDAYTITGEDYRILVAYKDNVDTLRESMTALTSKTELVLPYVLAIPDVTLVKLADEGMYKISGTDYRRLLVYKANTNLVLDTLVVITNKVNKQK